MADKSRSSHDAVRPPDEAALFSAALEAVPYGIAIWDDDERLILSNRRYAAICRLPPDEIRPGMTLARACALTVAVENGGEQASADLLAVVRERFAESARSPAGCSFEKALGGRVIRTTYTRDGGLGTVVSHEDVTDQRMRESELPGKLLSEIVESIGAGVCLWDADLRLSNWNSAFHDLQVLPGYELKRGVSLAEVLDHCLPLLNDPRTGADLEALARKLLARDGRLELDRALANGRIISVSYHPFSSGGWIAIYQDVTERRLGIRQLRESERELQRQNARLDASLDSMPYGFCIWDSDLTLNLWNERFIELYGLDEGAVRKGARLAEIFLASAEAGHFEGRTPGEMTNHFKARLNALKAGENFVAEDVLAAGRVVKISYRRAPDMSFVSTHEDITEQRDRLNALKQRESDLKRQNMRFTAAVDNMSQGLCMFDRDQKLVICNKRYADLYGLPPELVRPGTSLLEILKNRIERGIHPVTGPKLYIQRTVATAISQKETVDEYELKDGRVISVLHQPMSDGGWVATHQDITEQRRTEAQIRHLARHDGLTDLPNRMLFRERMEAVEARISRDEIWAALCIDLDHFKSVNDLHGHAVGDAVLQAVADRLRQSTRAGDVIARLGGDEFAILHGPLHQPRDAAALADRIVKAMAEPFTVDRHHILIGASVGISVAPGDGTDAETLMKNADLALYRAKADGRAAYHFFEKGMDALLQERLAVEIGLRTALADDQLELVFQPLFNLVENRVCAVEALLRWNHPERGVIMPNVIIPIAEETGLIVPIGEWVLRTACRAAAKWPKHIHIAVNLSPVQFKHRSLLNHVVSALAASGIAPDRLELEVTESALLADNEMTLKTLHQLRALGVRISMDDFGTGYSSLSYLRSFPFDKIKIDQSFVQDLSSRRDNLAIIKAVIGLGHSLGMSTTAEGIETEDQLDLVRNQGCTEVQGFLFSRPLSADAIGELLAPARPGHTARAALPGR